MLDAYGKLAVTYAVWTTASFGGEALEIRDEGDGIKFVYVDIVPVGRVVEITQ